ncbi:hypothetical protein E2I00_001144, partial [Balaenoptera physalus]
CCPNRSSEGSGRRLGPHVCLSGFGSGCCPGWAPSMGSGHCTLPLCSFGCGSGICIAPNVCSCQDGEQGPTCPEAYGPCGEYGCDLTCNHGGCQEVARVCPVGFSMTETAIGIRCTGKVVRPRKCPVALMALGGAVPSVFAVAPATSRRLKYFADTLLIAEANWTKEKPETNVKANIDECLSSSCEGHCVNTEGGFVCECGPGMQLSADRHSCQDTDECLGTPCQQRCKNSIGSYRCSCRTGFHLHGNRHSCVDCWAVGVHLQGKCALFLSVCVRVRLCVSVSALPKAVLAPSAILQPLQHPPKMLLLLPEAGRPALSPGHSPPSGAPGPPTGVRTTRLPSPTPALPTASASALMQLLSTPVATPVPSPSLLGTLRPPSQIQEKVVDGEVTCEKVTCEAACSHPVPSGDGGCCPLCTGCFHSGVIRAEGDVFSPPNQNCTVCVCLVSITRSLKPRGLEMCPASPPSVLPAPVRPPRSRIAVLVCQGGDGSLPASSLALTGLCPLALFQNGEVECSFTPCPELDCPREEWWLGPGQCCFTCREPAPVTGCSLDDNGVEFPVGQIWSPGDPCELCICQADGSVSCKRTDCVDSCPHPIRIPGQCCPDCSAGCTYTGRIFYNNQTFASVLDPCLSCICLLGSVACSPVDCPITCSYPFHPDGECCPVCRDCNYEGRKVRNGQVFTLDDEPCIQCICQLGEVSCEKMPCQQACSDPSTPPRDCCFSCPDSLEESWGLSPRGDVELSKVARTPRGDPEALLNCSSCPGPPAVSPQRPVLQLLQLLLRTNLSNMQTIPVSPSGAQALPSPPLGPGGMFPGEPWASQPPRPSPGPSIPPGASSLPPASPGAPGPPPSLSPFHDGPQPLRGPRHYPQASQTVSSHLQTLCSPCSHGQPWPPGAHHGALTGGGVHSVSRPPFQGRARETPDREDSARGPGSLQGGSGGR